MLTLRWEVLAGAAVVLVAVSLSAEQRLSVRYRYYYVTSRNEEAVVRCGGGVLLVPRLPAT